MKEINKENFFFIRKGIQIFVIILIISVFVSCVNGPGSDLGSSTKELTEFSFLMKNNVDLAGDIDGIVDGTGISINVPIGTNVSGLIASFHTTGINVSVNSVKQSSDITANNYSNSVVYTIKAEDGSTQDYTVIVGREDMANVPVNINGFEMGSIDCWDQTQRITVDVESISAYNMGKYEITYRLWYNVKQWAALNGYTFKNPGKEGSTGNIGFPPSLAANQPVVDISWLDCIVWCNALSEKEGLTPCYYLSSSRNNVYKDSTNNINPAVAWVDWNANGYRLPTEAEWEYAARYIDGTTFLRGDAPSGWVDNSPADGEWRIEIEDDWIEDDIDDDYSEVSAVAWWNSNSNITTHEVGQKNPNQLGIYDMSGNVFERCWDLFAAYPVEKGADPKGPGVPNDTIKNRCYRGGSYQAMAGGLQVTWRRGGSVTDTDNQIGFRVVRVP